MTAMLTENLPLIAAAPGGIKKLRELILELAVRGRLVPQDSSDEPASKLLVRIQAERERLILEGVGKREKPLDPLGPDDLVGDWPASWRCARLGDVVEIIRGITFPASEKSKQPQPGRVACLRTANVQDEIEWDDILYIREDFVSRDSQYLQPFDIVMSMANSRELVGKVALVGAEVPARSTFGGFLGVIRPKFIEPRYVMALLRTPSARSELIDSASQTTNIANVSLAKLRPLVFPIPPLAEQHRIVTKVDELMALCDRLESGQADSERAHQRLVTELLATLTQSATPDDFAANWQRLSQNFDTLFATEASIDALKQTILQLAVMGKLVPQDPADEDAGALLSRIGRERDRLLELGSIDRAKPMAAISEDDTAYRVPTGWAWCRFGDYALSISTGPFGSMIHQSDYVRGGVPLINPSHMIGDCIVPDPDVAVSNEMASALSSYRLSEGDVVLARRGEVGRLAIVSSRENGWICGTGSFVSRFSVEVSRSYLAILFRTDYVRLYLSGAAVGTTMVNLNHGILRNLPVPIPPISEQIRIVAKVDEIGEICDSLKYLLTASCVAHKALSIALVEQAVG